MPEGDKKDGALSFGMGREKADDVIIKKSEASGAEALRVGSKIKLAAEDAGFKLHGAIATIAETLQNGAQVSQKKNVNRGVRGQILSQAKVTCLCAEIFLLQALKYPAAAAGYLGLGQDLSADAAV